MASNLRVELEDTANRFAVASNGERSVILNMPMVMGRLTAEQALCLCAWLSVIAGLSDEELFHARRAIEAA